ncbi:hypothetical protein Tco_0180363 [Tanacetum coccineum]
MMTRMILILRLDEEEEGHLAPADSTVVALPAVDQAPFAEETKPFKTDESAATSPPHPAYRSRQPSLPLPPLEEGFWISPLGLRYEEIWRDLERDVGYRITDTWDEMLVDMPGVPATDDIELGRRMVAFTIRVRQDIDEIYTMLDDEQSERQLMAEVYVIRRTSGGSTAGSDYRVIGSGPQETGGDYRDASSELQETDTVH